MRQWDYFIIVFCMARCDSSMSIPIDLSDINPDLDLESRSFIASLNGENVVPPIETTATASLNLTYFRSGSEGWGEGWDITCEFFVKNTKQEEITGFDIHQGMPGVNGNVLAFLDKAPSVIIEYYMGDLRIYAQLDHTKRNGLNQVTTSQVVEEIEKRGTYADIHTIKHPSGEIQGQIVPRLY